MIIGMTQRPHKRYLKILQEYSSRGWVYRSEEGWIFAELTPDEQREFKSYGSDITIPRMMVRIPHGEIYQVTEDGDRPTKYWTRFPLQPGTYEAWLWADEISICRELGCEVTLHHGIGWKEWGIPSDWGPPLTVPPRFHSKEYAYIYILVDEFSGEIGYVGQTMRPEHRLFEHLRDTENPKKVAWIQRCLAQGHALRLFVLEKVPGAEAYTRERYWIAYYWKQGYQLTNRVCRGWKRSGENEANKR